MQKAWILSAVVVASPLASGQAFITDFESGLEGWSVSGRTTTSNENGNPAPSLDVELRDVFGADIRNSTLPTGDFSGMGPVEFTIDLNVRNIDFFGTPVSRDLVVDLRSFDVDGNGTFASVFAHLGVISADPNNWNTFSVVLDTNASALPDGWNGAGGEDPMTFEPILPDGVSFQDVISNVDEISFTTFVPGFFFGFSNFELAVDNVGYQVIPAPAGAFALGGLVFAARRKR